MKEEQSLFTLGFSELKVPQEKEVSNTQRTYLDHRHSKPEVEKK